MPQRDPQESTTQAVDRTNKSLIRVLIATAIASLVLLVITLIWFYVYVHSGRGVSCQTNDLVRSLVDLVNRLLADIRARTTRATIPKNLINPVACTQ
jgi:hypothetical protein